VPFPKVLHDSVRTQIESMRVLHADDVRQGLQHGRDWDVKEVASV